MADAAEPCAVLPRPHQHLWTEEELSTRCMYISSTYLGISHEDEFILAWSIMRSMPMNYSSQPISFQ